MKHSKWMLRVLAVAVVTAGAFLGGVLFQNRASANAAPAITAALLQHQIAGISEYAALEYRYTNVGKFEHRVDFYGWRVPWTTKSFIITYDGAMKLGVQGKDIGVETRGREIRIRLPRAQVLSHEVYEDTLKVLDQSKNLLNPIRIEDYTTFAADQKKEMERKIQQDNLFAEADQRAQQQIGAFLKSVLPDGDEYTVVFTE